jgi:hypothetical protein
MLLNFLSVVMVIHYFNLSKFSLNLDFVILYNSYYSVH